MMITVTVHTFQELSGEEALPPKEDTQGVAPGCSLISVKVLDQKGNGFASDVLSGLKWIEKHRQEFGIRIINISVGSFNRKGMSEDSALVKGVDAAWDAGFCRGRGRWQQRTGAPYDHDAGDQP